MDMIKLIESGNEEAIPTVKEYLRIDLQNLFGLWKKQFPNGDLGNLPRHMRFAQRHDFADVIEKDLPALVEQADTFILENKGNHEQHGFEPLLHPLIRECSYDLYLRGHLREAVLNSFTAISDHIRGITGLDEDGDRLIGRVMSLENPYIVLSNLNTESGQNDQKGFMQLYKGAFQGIRNPKAHSLTHDLNPLKAAQYLIFASLLMRRLDEAEILKPAKT